MLVAATLVARKPVGTLGGSTSSLGGVVKSTLLLGVETLPAPSTARTWSTYLLLGVRLRTVAVVTLPPTSATTLPRSKTRYSATPTLSRAASHEIGRASCRE